MNNEKKKNSTISIEIDRNHCIRYWCRQSKKGKIEIKIWKNWNETQGIHNKYGFNIVRTFTWIYNTFRSTVFHSMKWLTPHSENHVLSFVQPIHFRSLGLPLHLYTSHWPFCLRLIHACKTHQHHHKSRWISVVQSNGRCLCKWTNAEIDNNFTSVNEWFYNYYSTTSSQTNESSLSETTCFSVYTV